MAKIRGNSFPVIVMVVLLRLLTILGVLIVIGAMTMSPPPRPRRAYPPVDAARGRAGRTEGERVGRVGDTVFLD